ncbi:hypothetical protein GMRT_14964 [Giardia muris]|uniref:Uncharacterized protein n=1 Tax=Giardia muris TaxID=5742 RepID=A0A4Z1T7R4_GIAMU|nr:hypothetical protein GMRT_14964 [Giardia muris]|eukprot:TNJ29197.1 hypothetical protein GMRT_14964 [Giardia muris]
MTSRIQRAYPPIPKLISPIMSTFLIGVSVLICVLTILMGVYLGLDVGYCGLSGSVHTIALSMGTGQRLSHATGPSYDGEYPVYDGGVDTFFLRDGVPLNELKEKTQGSRSESLQLGLILNHTFHKNRDKLTRMVGLRFTSIPGTTIQLNVGNPNRKRMLITEPWFDPSYLRHAASNPSEQEQEQELSAEIPIWFASLKEAAVGRQNGRTCNDDYDLNIAFGGQWTFHPLLIRGYHGQDVKFSNVRLRGEVVIDTMLLGDESLTLHLESSMLETLLIPKPSQTIDVRFHDVSSYLQLVLPKSDPYQFVGIVGMKSSSEVIMANLSTVTIPRPKVRINFHLQETYNTVCVQEMGAEIFLTDKGMLVPLLSVQASGSCACEDVNTIICGSLDRI